MKIREAMLFCLVLLFIISLGCSAVSAADSNDYSNIELDQDLTLSDSVVSDFEENKGLSNLCGDFEENKGLSNLCGDFEDSCISTNDNNLDICQNSNSKDNLKSNSTKEEFCFKSGSLKDGSNAIYVSPSGNDENDGLTRETPVGSISKAVSISSDGYVIYLLNGVYNQDKSITLSKDLTFIGEDGAIINRTAKLSVFSYTNEKIKTVSFKNIIFISESAAATNPILSMAAHANLICDNCTFTHIISNKNGVVRFMGNATGTLNNCKFIDLDGTSNAAASYINVLGESKVKVNNCTFKNISNDFLRAVVYVNNDLASLNLTNSHFYDISGNAMAIVENRGTLEIFNCAFNDIALSGNSPKGIVWASETINKDSKTYINSSSFYNNSISTESVGNTSIIQAKAPIIVEYSSFINNDIDFIVNNDNEIEIIANYNWWGTNNNPKALVSDGVTIDNWFIMSVDFNGNDLIAGEEYPITINLNQITNEEGQSYTTEKGIDGAEVIVSSQNGEFKVNDGTIINDVPLGGGTLEDGGKIAKVYTNNGLVNLVYAPVIDGPEILSFKSGNQEFIYNIELAEAIYYNEYYVSKSGSDENDGLTNSTAFKTISHAIDISKSSKVNAKIHISSGVYEENGFEIVDYGEGFESPHFSFIGYGNVVIDGKGQNKSLFTIRNGELSFKNIRFTNVNGASSGGAINIASNDYLVNENNPNSEDMVFVNLTIANCTFDNLIVNGNGGAISYVDGSGKVNIKNAKFYNLTSNSDGGAVYIKESDSVNLKITGSNFKDNIANNGGALFLDISRITIGNSNFVNNSANNFAGSIAFYNATAVVENCIISNSSSKKQASAILIDNENENVVTIKSSTIENNTGILGNGLFDGGSVGVDDGSEDNGQIEENYAIYVLDGTLDVSYSSIVNNLSLETVESSNGSKQGIAIADNNWWGTNNPVEVVKGSNITLEKWLILQVTRNNTGVLKVGNAINITIDFNHVMTSSGEILPLTGGIISREFAIRMNATAGRIYPSYLVTKDKEASAIFTVEDGGSSLDIKVENALVHIDFIVNNYYGVIYISNNGNDDWNGSIEAPILSYEKAIDLALEEGGSHHIFFLEGTYEFCDVDIDSTYLTIEGEGIDKSILDGVQFTGGMISNFESDLIIKNITLINGVNTGSSGGTITNMGNLTLDTVKVSDSIVKNGNGGAIYSVGHLTIKNSTFSNNVVENGASGGSGGVIYADGYYTSLDYAPTLEIFDSEFIDNSAKGSSFGGGAIYMQVVNGNKTIKNTKFINNDAVAGGAIFLQRCEGNFEMDNVSFIGNIAKGSSSYYGGGALCLIGITDSRVGNIIITNSLFENNSAKNTRGGGAVFDRNVNLNISNSVIYNNKDTAENIQIFKDATVYLPSGGKISLEDNWWGVNDLSVLSTLASNVSINRWVVMDASLDLFDDNSSVDSNSGSVLNAIVDSNSGAGLNAIVDSNSETGLNEYIIKAYLNKYNDGTLIKDNVNAQNYYPFERLLSLESVNGVFNPESTILEDNIGESVLSSPSKNNTVIATIDGQSFEFNTNDLYVNTVIHLELENNISTKGTDLNISLNDIDSNPINASVVLNINGNEQIVNVSDGKATLEINGLNEGINNITVSFNGKGKYLESEDSSFIEVKLIKVNLSLFAEDIVVGESSTVKVFLFDEFNNPLNLTVKLSVNGKDYPIELEDGKGAIDIGPIEESGNYTLIACLDNDDYNGNKTSESIIMVYGIGNYTVKHTGLGDALDIQSAIDSASPNDIIRLGNYNYTNVSNINITKDLSIVGSEGTTVTSSGDGSPIFNIPAKSEIDLESVNITGIEFKLNSRDIVVKAIAINDTEDSLYIDVPAITITDNVFETADEDVVPESVNILCLESESRILSPTNEITISNNIISAGMDPFDFKVTSIGSGENIDILPQNLAPQKQATVIVFNNMSTTALGPSDGRTGDYFYFNLTDINGKPIANAPMQIGFNGKVYDYEHNNISTNENGTAKLQINLGYKGDYTFAICFLGNEDYNASFAVAVIKVSTQKPTLNVPNKSYKANAKTKTLTATFNTEKGNPIAGKKVTFTVNGKNYSAKTDENGVATVNVSLNKKGTYNFMVKYGGDSTYAAVSQKAKLTIK